ncbi:MAG: hypothetical protein J6W35_02105 [Eubacterium sp.]|nr:hypothetical protein [Eubacterium sp.]
MKTYLKRTIVMVLALAMVFGVAGCDLFKKTNKGHTDLFWYMNLTEEKENGKEVHFTSDMGDVAAVALEDDYAEEYGIVKDGDCFVNIDSIKSGVDDRFHYDKNEGLVMFTNATEVITSDVGKSELKNGESKDYQISFVENGKCYVNMEFVTDCISADYKLFEGTKKCPAIISLNYKTGKVKEGALDDDIEMRTNGDYQNLIVKELKEGTKFKIIKEGENWDKVKAVGGLIGYVPTKYVDDVKTVESVYKSDEDTYNHQLIKDGVNLVWDAVYNQSANANLKYDIKNVKGANVISPTWFEMENKNGGLVSRASDDYVKTAHKKGMEVWALLDDFKSKKISHYVLSHTSSRKRLISSLMDSIDGLGVDGINIDFEFVTEGVAKDYLQFLREMSVECRKNRITLSVDNYAAMGHTAYYDWKQQYKIADYVIFMNYDEHNAGDDEAGSVSSLEFMENAISNSIEQIGESNRVVNGMPFFTRLWEMTPEGKGTNKGTFVEDAVNGNYYLNSQALTMNKAERAWKDAKAKPTFDKTTGQNYATWDKGNTTYEIWLEDATSIKSRLKLTKKYKLGGNAYWALGQEKDSIWDVIENNE